MTSHVVKPRADQPPLKTTYTYTHFDQGEGIYKANNFVGNNSGISWRDDGLDNLYRADSSYRYSVTAHYWKGDKVVRKQTQTFNRYHLMTLQTLEQDGHIEETETCFHENLGADFERQPAYFQLPHIITKRWKMADDASKLRLETATTRYDDYGNIIEEVNPNGVRTTYEYYGKDGESGASLSCPADPQGFVRNLKSKTVYPAPDQPDSAPVQRTRLSYKAMPALGHPDDAADWLAPTEEQVVELRDPNLPSEAEQLLIRVERAYLNKPENAYLHGRPSYQTTTRYGAETENPLRRAIDSRTARIDWYYEKITDPKHGLEYWTQQTLTGFDLVQKTTRQATSALHGQSVFEQDDFGNDIRYRYDSLARLVEEIVAPGMGEDEVTITHAYALATHPEQGVAGQARQWVTSSTGVVSIFTFDGCNRVVIEERETELPDAAQSAQKKRQCKRVAQHTYDELGQLSEETTFDYYDDKTLTLTSSFEYDGWGRLCKTTLPTGVTQHSEHSPFGEEGDMVTRWIETPDKPGVRQLQQVSASNRFDKLNYQYRLDEKGKVVGRHDFFYDGLGRCTSEKRQVNLTGERAKPPQRLKKGSAHVFTSFAERVTQYAYDTEGRVTRCERPDRSAVLSEFALHSPAALAEQLLIEPRKDTEPTLAWHREYDGLERLKSMAAGPQQETYEYKDNTSLVETRSTAANRTFTYHYRPTRSAQPERIEVKSLSTTFGYDPKTSAISTATDEQGTRSYSYTDQGYLQETQWQDNNAASYRCTYRNSLQGLPLGYTDSDGTQVSHHYNALGQVEGITSGNLVATFEYDSAGRPWKTTTEDRVNQQMVLCVQTYDSLGREEKREQTLTRQDGSTLTQSLSLTWREDDQLHTRTLTCDGQQVLLETFDYDTLDRLENHACEGTTLPRNAAGRAIRNQFFVYDALNNLTECYTDFADGETDDAFYTYDGFILEKAEHTLQPDYLASQAFEHDADGNLLNDEWGNQLTYDDHGRLSEVQRASDAKTLYRYRYDGHNDLIGVRHEDAAEVLRRYQGYRVSSTREADLLTEYLYAGDRPLGLQRPAQTEDNRLFVTDAANSVLAECSRDDLHEVSYTAYGDSPDNDQLVGLLGFNGEARERALGWSLLGRGYRAYNPGLMRFHSPDAAAPEAAGINPYTYCRGNPVNWYDPSGHYGVRHSTEAPYIPPKPQPKPKADWRAWFGVALGAVFAVVSFLLLPPVGLTAAFALGAGSLAIDVAATAVSAGALVSGSEAAADWAFWLGIASALSTLGIVGYSRFGAKGAGKGMSIGTQTATDTASVGVGTSIRPIARAIKPTRGPVTVSPVKEATLPPPSNMTSSVTPELDWDVIPPGKKGVVHDNPLFIDDSPSPAIQGPSSSITKQTSVSALTPKSPSSQQAWGSAIGANEKTPDGNWKITNIYNYIPFRGKFV
ncbi:hypothetical protein E6B08_08130 [Pseudomonas putida]|uniref:RHS repeat-associated core domain-containing protein n=1 Tax=Pseudomonas putida TaxID=303 RepID=A0A4D6X5X9_PSEPU|nr:RHS repeat-associated core domain-containing protein [Pseudomonas putida]QCI11366.1 hypothetical protein E6B08_08130 [Pseudomonas putida]